MDGVSIDINSVSFSYGGEEVLHEINASFESGKIIGILGPSGCGKSTLLSLLMRFFDCNSGNININGKDIREIDTHSLRTAEGLVEQSASLFAGTIRDNISIGKPGANINEIREAAKRASIDDFIMSLPDKYDTEIGNLSDRLSGGEQQRIGIARAFLHDGPVLLLDEPTSNLDSMNEGIILKSLMEEKLSESKKRTVIIVSHRLSTLGICDVIYKMETA